MKDLIKKLVLALLLLAVAAGATWLVYVHRRAIRAFIKGEALPDCMPEHRKCCCRGRTE